MRASGRRVVTRPLVLLVGAFLAAGCAGGTSPASPPTTAPPSPAPALTPDPSVAGRDAPPDATLTAEGGDPATGQLGSYTWFESGSDAPWLPGTPLAVGVGEPLTVAFVPPGDVASWTARYAPAGADPAGARPLGEGMGGPVFGVPEPGRWTVAVTVIFGDGIGSATYFWEVTVT